MKQQISLREANQHFSRYIEAVERGAEIIITRRGRPIAKIVKLSRLREPTAAQIRAWNLIKSSAKNLNIGKMTRDELHERTPDHA
ncbi:MAG: type II toxin-antitoxin system prevent-host-death family antitoxin [Betaproteobacteria bacterium]|nr:type II toxin-antitoxin system prevent-host-death family antitoxin [Betaproteobacteria bacterium]